MIQDRVCEKEVFQRDHGGQVTVANEEEGKRVRSHKYLGA